ncbi:MAG: ATP-binding protein, partial [Longimicrobiales bacterium]|nr:ATP-binding protein [Longimicrobiales bacterium]
MDDRAPHLIHVSGLRGGGKSTLVRHVLRDYPGVLHVCPPLPDPDQRAALARRLGTALSSTGDETAIEDTLPLPHDADWSEIFQDVLRRASRTERPFVLFLDDAHRLTEARSRFVEPMQATMREAASTGVALHVVLAGPGGGLPDVGAKAVEGISHTGITVGPLPFRPASALLPGRTPSGIVRAYGVFGGIPAVLRRLDRDVTVGTNVRRLLLSPEGGLIDAGARWVEGDLQSPSRYFAILRTLAKGEADWGTVHEGVSDLTRSGQVAPYLSRLEEL